MKSEKHNKKQIKQNKPIKLSGDERQGLVVALFGAQADIEDDNGQVFQCHLRKNAEPIITGDRVLWRPDSNQSGVVVQHLPRTSLFYSRKKKLIAANVDAIIIVTAPLPIFSEHMLDRYLVAAEHLQIQPVILLNKMDLLLPQDENNIKSQLALYEKIGYNVMFSSTKLPNGLAELDAFLCGKTSVLVGASGVGKSSITRALTTDPSIKVGDTSTIGLGKHTTTVTRLYHLARGGNLIDSPGVREFGLSSIDKNTLMAGFVEFLPHLNNCKFRNCLHINDPGCGLQAALLNGDISQKRFESYQRILEELPGKESQWT